MCGFKLYFSLLAYYLLIIFGIHISWIIYDSIV